MLVKTAGLVLRETRVGEADKLLCVLTPTDGKITVKARGALRKGSRTGSATQLFAFSEMALFQGKSQYTLNEASPVELFFPLRERVESMALAAYVCEVLELLSDADSGMEELLRLGLNTLYALSEQTASEALIKAAFELRVAALAGYAPEAEGACAVCGAAEDLYFSPAEGAVFCRLHLPGDRGAVYLRGGAAEAMSYVLSCDARRIFSFRLGEEGMRAFSVAAERYLLAALGRGFRTLDYYHKILSSTEY